jgi:TRAP-type C4-dicarboxylate transport system permease small subunit
MKTLILAIEQKTTAFALALACAMLAVASSLGMFQVIARFVLEITAEWTEVLIRFSLIWMVFLAIPAAFRRGAMVSVDVLNRHFGEKGRLILRTVAALASVALIVIVIWWGWDYAVRSKVQSMAGLEEVSMFWAYLAMPVGGIFSLIGIAGQWLDPQNAELENAQ